MSAEPGKKWSKRKTRSMPGAIRNDPGPGFATVEIRPFPSPGGETHRLGLLPRPVGLRCGHDQGDRVTNRAVRSRLQGPDPRAAHHERRAVRGPQPQLHKGRHRRGRVRGQKVFQLGATAPYRIGEASFSAPRPPHLGRVSTACAATTPPAPHAQGLGPASAPSSSRIHIPMASGCIVEDTTPTQPVMTSSGSSAGRGGGGEAVHNPAGRRSAGD